MVLHRSEDPFGHLDQGRYLAEHIEHASFVTLPGGDLGLHPLVGDRLGDEVAAFLTGVRVDPTVERVLTTILFSDIVGSTERAAVSLGDQQWHTLLDRHDATVRDQLRIFRGREINTTGDGFVACFDRSRERFAVPGACSGPRATWGFGFGLVCTQVSAKYVATISEVSQFTLPPESAPSQLRTKFSSPVP